MSSIAHQTAALDPPVLVVAVALDQVPVPVARLAVQLVLQAVPETEEENAVVAKVLMLLEDMIIRKRRGIKRENETEIGIEIARRRRRREAILFLINLNLKGALGIISVTSVILFLVIPLLLLTFHVNFVDLLPHEESVENVRRSLDQQRYILAI